MLEAEIRVPYFYNELGLSEEMFDEGY